MSHLSPSNSSCRLVPVWGSVMTSQCGGVMWLHPLWKSTSIISDDWSIQIRATGPMEEERSWSALRWTQLVILSSLGKTAAHTVFTEQSPIRSGNRVTGDHVGEKCSLKRSLVFALCLFVSQSWIFILSQATLFFYMKCVRCMLNY